MSDTVTITVDGKTLEAKPGQMLIEVTDANNIYIPRFCYHPQLSVAANCRMCLVEVEKAPKPLPACATPINDGMVVKTQSALALDSQKSVMEFLLINHPLDCPICDQGGECELQDLAMGYGRDVSRYQESKRVVQDKNIGPLVQTDMTRCIHCTRCIRFGEEIAGLRELGATGRGEHMEIGTYVEKSMRSELSGNVIDVCPVGALTSKPFRYSARAWEMKQGRGIAPHDCVGSNLEVHYKGNIIKRVVPGENTEVNEVWISDRDRFSYEGLYADDRLTEPVIKQDGEWHKVSWQQALTFAANGLKNIQQQFGAEHIGALLSPSATTEEAYLLTRLIRGLGSNNIDHRLYQQDFSGDEDMPVFPGLNHSIAELEKLETILLIGSHLRYEQPMLNHRVRKAALKGAQVYAINRSECDFNYDHQALTSADPSLAVSIYCILQTIDKQAAIPYSGFIQGSQNELDSEFIENLIHSLMHHSRTTILIGNQAFSDPQFALICSMVNKIAQLCDTQLSFITPGANSSGAWLAGAVPHRQAFGKNAVTKGYNTQQMIEQPLKSYILFNLEPEQDVLAANTSGTIQQAEFNIAITGFESPQLLSSMNVLLPMALFAENEGSFVNIEGRQQAFSQLVKPQGDIKHGWKIIKALMNESGLDTPELNTLEDIQKQLFDSIEQAKQDAASVTLEAFAAQADAQAEAAANLHYSIDPMLRRAKALQQREAGG